MEGVEPGPDKGSAAAVLGRKTALSAKLRHLVAVPPATAAGEAAAWLAERFAECADASLSVRLQEDARGARSHAVVAVARNEPLAETALFEAMRAMGARQLVLRREVGAGALFDGRRFAVRVDVSHVYPGRYRSGHVAVLVGDAGSLCSGAVNGVSSKEEYSLEDFPGRAMDEAMLRVAAERALEGVNLGVGPNEQLYSAMVDLVPDFDDETNTMTCAWVIDVQARDDESAFRPVFASASPLDVVLELVSEPDGNCMDEAHLPYLECNDTETLHVIVDGLVEFLCSDGRGNLLKGRAVIVLADCLWLIKSRGSSIAAERDIVRFCRDEAIRSRLKDALSFNVDESDHGESYLAFMNQFMSAANLFELLDFRTSLAAASDRLPARDAPLPVVSHGGDVVHVSRSGMRVGLTSANASDNWTQTKLRGSAVLNAAIDLGLDNKPAIQVSVSVDPAKSDRLVLESDDGITPAGRKWAEFNVDTRRADHVSLADGSHSTDEAWISLDDVSDPKDPLRLVKQAVQFVNVDIRGLRVVLRNRGVSRSGFASSSSVAVNLLNALFHAVGHGHVVEDRVYLGSLALMFENELGLKSGRQDVDGPIFPGVKHLRYPKTDGIVEPLIEQLQVPDLERRLLLVDTGVCRPQVTSLKRGLNMRHLAFLTRSAPGFVAIRKSLGVHAEMHRAVCAGNWPRLGQLMIEYMHLREQIDPGATGEKHVLRRELFDLLRAEELSWGGMFSGAMGGGVAMIVARHDDVTPLRQRLLAIRDANPIFKGLKLIDYQINRTGIVYTKEERRE